MENDASAPKKSRLDECGDAPRQDIQTKAFEGFQVVKILNENAQRKVVFVHGRFAGSDDEAVAILEKNPFNESAVREMLSGCSSTKTTMHNTIYSTFDMHPKAEFNGVKATLIYPATEKHIAKYGVKDMSLISETAEDYINITLPCLKSGQFSLQWVYNILSGESEADRVVLSDPDEETGFVLLPDMKWDGQQTAELYLVAIARKRDILSLRQLGSQHLPLLNNMLDASREVIGRVYGVAACKLRAYIHYQPSYYHLHVHFTHLRFDAPGNTVGRAHLLTDVIDNIAADPTFYQKKTLTFIASETDALYQRYAEAKRV